MRKKIVLGIFFLLVVSKIAFSAGEEEMGQAAEKSGKFREALTHYTAALQTVTDGSVEDQQLREKIIGVVQKLNPPPAIPEEANAYEGRAEAAATDARTPQDMMDAAGEYKKALKLAPWVVRYYFNLGLVLEKAGAYEEAMRNLKFYLAAAPGAPDAAEVKKKIAGLEYRMEKAAAPAATAFDPSSLSGRWRAGGWIGNLHEKPERGSSKWSFRDDFAQVQVVGNSFHATIFIPGWSPFEFDGSISGNAITGTALWIESTDPAQDRFNPCGRIQKVSFEGIVNPTEPGIVLIVQGLRSQAPGCESESTGYAMSYLLLR